MSAKSNPTQMALLSLINLANVLRDVMQYKTLYNLYVENCTFIMIHVIHMYNKSIHIIYSSIINDSGSF